MSAGTTRGAARRPASFAGLRTSALLEIGCFFVVALLADRFLFAGDRFTSLQPHPFWAIVLLMAAQYGTGEALLAAAVASTLVLIHLPEQGFDENLYAWTLRVTALPALWVVAALVLGEIRAGQRRERDTLREDLGAAREEAEAITEAYERLSRIRSELEARVAAQVRTVRAMYDASRAIDRKSTSEVILGIASLVRSVLAPKKFSLFFLGASGLELVAADGWTAADAYAARISSNSILFQAVVARRETLVAVNPEHELILGQEGVLAGPLVSEESGIVIGMLKIDELAFAQFNPALMQNFRIVCEWIATAYDKAQEFESAYAAQRLPELVHARTRF